VKNSLPSLIESFFIERLISQRQASPHTIASYRDTFRLLFIFIQDRLKKSPSLAQIEDLSPESVLDFLKDLEQNRGCSARSRNQRLSALRSFFHYLAFKVPEKSGLIQQVLAIPKKRHDKAVIDFLNQTEIEVLLAAPDQQTWIGRRDYLLLSLAVQTGLRLSEITGLCWNSVCFDHGANVRVVGKGRKERAIPLSKELKLELKAWIHFEKPLPNAPVFPSRQGAKLSSDAVQRLLSKYVGAATKKCPSLKRKKISPHVLRHSTAMRLLQSGVGQSVIALWLGHESVETTQIYLNADLKMKEKVLEKVAPLKNQYKRYQPSDRLLAFLEGL
jgi:site-specific recombinase XerD